MGCLLLITIPRSSLSREQNLEFPTGKDFSRIATNEVSCEEIECQSHTLQGFLSFD